MPQRAAPSCFFCKPFLFPASLPARLPAHDYLRPRKLFQQSSVFHCFFFALSQVLKPNPICNPSPLWASTPRTKLVFLAKFDRSLIFHDALGKKSISVIFLPTEPSLDALVLSPPSPPGWWVGRTPPWVLKIPLGGAVAHVLVGWPEGEVSGGGGEALGFRSTRLPVLRGRRCEQRSRPSGAAGGGPARAARGPAAGSSLLLKGSQ